ncbi:TerC family protein [Sciscionella sediminilitoris]|uniref:TerC family protein n=1 Tax=Sciscionella sediminilitoris TaxID=1445613 RepID=UPI0004DF2C85|nr:TerC family protein [Sciscionella sp. SE31]
MDVPVWVWLATIGGLIALFAVDFFIVDHNPHKVTAREATRWVLFYVGCAILFGLGVLYFSGSDPAIEFFTGYITEYSLSVDNLFIFMVIMTSFAVPSIHQHRVLLIGIIIALVLRGLFIAVGAQLINNFVWVFFVFGAFLIWTAIGMVRKKDEDANPENFAVRFVRKLFPVTEDFHGHHSFVRVRGKRYITPMFVVIIAIGSADVLFAVDSIPAIFGITQEAYLVFAANAFALMGLRQLYFLLGRLVDRLVYLSYGLAVILGFIGLKLVVHALHEYHAAPDWLDINNWVSLGVIVGVLAVTTVLSLRKARADEVAAERDGSEDDQVSST